MDSELAFGFAHFGSILIRF